MPTTYPLLHEPAVFANLAVCLFAQPATTGKTAVGASPAREFLVLGECLADGRAQLYETGNVGQLEIENLADLDLFLQAGDMVKGGRQDRTLGADFTVPAHSGRMRVPAFCVEQGRWSQRRGESAAKFSSSEETLSSAKLKRVIRKEQSQSAVWEEVAAVQSKLEASVGSKVTADASPSSLQLSMEDGAVRSRVEDYTAALHALLEAHPDAVGFVYLINGKPSGAEAYGTSALFRKLWSKGLRAASVEALGERSRTGEEEAAIKLLDRAEIAAWLAAPGRRGSRAKTSRSQVTDRVTLQTRETAKQIVFETLDAAQEGRCVHATILAQ